MDWTVQSAIRDASRQIDYDANVACLNERGEKMSDKPLSTWIDMVHGAHWELPCYYSLDKEHGTALISAPATEGRTYIFVITWE